MAEPAGIELDPGELVLEDQKEIPQSPPSFDGRWQRETQMRGPTTLLRTELILPGMPGRANERKETASSNTTGSREREMLTPRTRILGATGVEFDETLQGIERHQ